MLPFDAPVAVEYRLNLTSNFKRRSSLELPIFLLIALIHEGLVSIGFKLDLSHDFFDFLVYPIVDLFLIKGIPLVSPDFGL